MADVRFVAAEVFLDLNGVTWHGEGAWPCPRNMKEWHKLWNDILVSFRVSALAVLGDGLVDDFDVHWETCYLPSNHRAVVNRTLERHPTNSPHRVTWSSENNALSTLFGEQDHGE